MQKLQNRKVALSGSTTLTQEQKQKFSAILQIEYMSSEESAEESGEDEHMGKRLKVLLLLHTLPWRNQSVNEMFQSLDRKKARKRTPRAAEMCRKRVPWGAEPSSPSGTTAKLPPSCPAWAKVYGKGSGISPNLTESSERYLTSLGQSTRNSLCLARYALEAANAKLIKYEPLRQQLLRTYSSVTIYPFIEGSLGSRYPPNDKVLSALRIGHTYASLMRKLCVMSAIAGSQAIWYAKMCTPHHVNVVTPTLAVITGDHDTVTSQPQ
ncbi:hypothetical protein EMCRGX_G005420 [Ephydatia muelleri]